MELMIGITIGALLCYILMRNVKSSGSFIMDFTDPMKDVCRIELSEDLNSLYSKKRIILDVRVHE